LREALLLKLFFLSILAGLAGTTAGIALLFIIAYAFYGGDVDTIDVLSFIPLMLVPALLMCGLLYAPTLLWLRRRRKNCAPARLFVLTPAFALNVPAFLVLLAGLFTGNVFFGLSEILLFAVAFIVAGLIFGSGFVRYCESKSVREKFVERVRDE
jgi:ABC-type antimicrobial peptide transport system permease subunit